MDGLSNRWFLHICVKCENDTKGRIRFCKGFDAFPWPLFLGRGGGVQLSLHSCAQLSDGCRSDGIAEGTLRELLGAASVLWVCAMGALGYLQ